MTEKDILNLIQNGENSSVEFKSAAVRPEFLAKELISLANTNGGVILLGVEDNSSITGLNGSKNYEEWLANLIRNNIQPPLNVDYTEYLLENETIGIIDVPKGPDKPLPDTSGKFYVRVGSTCRIASINEIMRLFQQSGFYHFDSTPLEKSSFKHLQLGKLADYFERYEIAWEDLNENERVSLLTNSDILNENSQINVGGALIFAEKPQGILAKCQ